MIDFKVIRIEETEGQKTVFVQHGKKTHEVDCCGRCPFIEYLGGGDCDITDEVLKGDIWNSFGEKCPFFAK